jgi:hypothetical protein
VVPVVLPEPVVPDDVERLEEEVPELLLLLELLDELELEDRDELDVELLEDREDELDAVLIAPVVEPEALAVDAALAEDELPRLEEATDEAEAVEAAALTLPVEALEEAEDAALDEETEDEEEPPEDAAVELAPLPLAVPLLLEIEPRVEVLAAAVDFAVEVDWADDPVEVVPLEPEKQPLPTSPTTRIVQVDALPSAMVIPSMPQVGDRPGRALAWKAP